MVSGYTDQRAADALEMPKSTVRKWRADLQEAEYILCQQGYQCQNIVIHRWRNPRETNPEAINIPVKDQLSESWCPNNSTMINLDTHPYSKVDTPTLDSDSIHSHTPTPKATTSDSPNGHKSPTPRPRDPVWDAIAEAWRLNPKASRIATIKAVLLGTSKRYPECNLEVPATPDQIDAFQRWYRRKYPGTDMPMAPEKIQAHWYAFLADEAARQQQQGMTDKEIDAAVAATLQEYLGDQPSGDNEAAAMFAAILSTGDAA